jgi:DNA repair ATPase RecN
VGWYVVWRQNGKRETRKEARSLIDSIEKRIAEIESIAYKYYKTEPDKSLDLAASIKIELHRLADSLVVLARLNSKFTVSDQLIHFRQSITGGDFESRERLVRQSSDPLLQEITLAATQLSDEIESIFGQAFLGHWA